MELENWHEHDQETDDDSIFLFLKVLKAHITYRGLLSHSGIEI